MPTINQTIAPEQEWVEIAISPIRVVIKSDYKSRADWALAVGDEPPEGDGEIHRHGDTWKGGPFDGKLYLRAINYPHHFAITVIE